ncbi:MAG: cobalamin biosynthesis protein [Thauera sp.]|jgi:cobalt-precorrin 5A hydrolase|nr:cobalamin biosynthesis protein [Thauera sp.]
MIVAGFGARRHTTLAELRAALQAALQASALSAEAVSLLAAPVDKLIEIDAFAELAAELGCALLGVSAAALQAQATPTQSAASLSARGCGSVAEAAALIAAGAEARLAQLRCTRQFSPARSASCALAEGVQA